MTRGSPDFNKSHFRPCLQRIKSYQSLFVPHAPVLTFWVPFRGKKKVLIQLNLGFCGHLKNIITDQRVYLPWVEGGRGLQRCDFVSCFVSHSFLFLAGHWYSQTRHPCLKNLLRKKQKTKQTKTTKTPDSHDGINLSRHYFLIWLMIFLKSLALPFSAPTAAVAYLRRKMRV